MWGTDTAWVCSEDAGIGGREMAGQNMFQKVIWGGGLGVGKGVDIQEHIGSGQRPI